MMPGIRAAVLFLLAASVAGAALAQSPGADLYKNRCAICHGQDGLAASPGAKSLKVPSFKSPEMLAASDSRFYLTTLRGENRMPAYAGNLTDSQIKEVLAYIRTLQK